MLKRPTSSNMCLLRRTFGAAIAVLMLGFYVPMAYLTDRFFYQRQVRKEEKEQLARSQQRSGQ